MYIPNSDLCKGYNCKIRGHNVYYTVLVFLSECSILYSLHVIPENKYRFLKLLYNLCDLCILDTVANQAKFHLKSI